MAATTSTAPWLLTRAFRAFTKSHSNTHLPLYKTHLSVSLPFTLRFSGMCHLTQAVKRDADVLLKSVEDKGLIEEVKHILDMATRASFRREVLHTDFLTPPTLKESMLVLGKLADVKAVAQGGYPQAERCRLSVGHPEALTSDPDVVAALSITGNFGFQLCSHGDFLGAILGTGIARDKLGDILCRESKGLKFYWFLNLLIMLYHHWTRLVMFPFLVQEYLCLLLNMNLQGQSHLEQWKHR